jgi:hypothetical protein
MRRRSSEWTIQAVRWHVAGRGPWLVLVAMVVLPLVLTACGGGSGGGPSY